MKQNRTTVGTGPVGRTENFEGAEAFVHGDEEQLLNLVSGCLAFEPKFYTKPGELETDIITIATRVARSGSPFVSQLAAYARNELYLRSVPQLLQAITAHEPATKQHVRGYAPLIIKRADEITEALAAYQNLYGTTEDVGGGRTRRTNPIPNSLKKALRDSFGRFDEYQFAKYNRKSVVTLKDVMNIAHPPDSINKDPELLQRLYNDTMKTPVTWETEISAKGNNKETWTDLIHYEKLPYMAALRNLRNILNAGVDDITLRIVLDMITDPERVARSKQFPFRFFSAYREIQKVGGVNAQMVLDALDDACELAYSNIPRLKGTTMLACDTSGSMKSPISQRSSIEQIEIGVLLGLAMNKYLDKGIFTCFADSLKEYPISKRSGIVSSVEAMITKSNEVGWSTNGWLVPEYARQKGIHVDRFMIFTDMEMWDSTGIGGWGWIQTRNEGRHTLREGFLAYQNEVNPDAKMYIFNLAGHGHFLLEDGRQDVITFNGWSDKILNLINLREQDPQAQVDAVKAISPFTS